MASDTLAAARTDLYEVAGGTLKLHFHAGQWRAWQSRRRFVSILAGTQSGKTSFAPIWLWREIRERGPGDYAFVTPTFKLLELKALPEFRRLFERYLRLGHYTSSPVRKFAFSSEGARRMFGRAPDVPTAVYFGYADDPESLESATYKGAVADEAGQTKFRRESWEALLRRLSLAQGRVLVPTTPYHSHGWLRTEIWDKAARGDPDVELVQFESTMNPAFPVEEFERARRDLPAWKFDLFYRGLLTKPPGAIYDCFDRAIHTCPRFAIPASWPRYLGLDFGGVNTAGVFWAQEPGTPRLYAYREYLAGGRSAREHAAHLVAGEPMLPTTVGGAMSEGQWRQEFRLAGLPVREPDQKDVEVGIQRVYGALKRGELVFFDDLTRTIEEFETYRRVLDSNGEPTEQIADKQTFHLLDAVRYIVGFLKRGGTAYRAAVAGTRPEFAVR